MRGLCKIFHGLPRDREQIFETVGPKSLDIILKSTSRNSGRPPFPPPGYALAHFKLVRCNYVRAFQFDRYSPLTTYYGLRNALQDFKHILNQADSHPYCQRQ